MTSIDEPAGFRAAMLMPIDKVRSVHFRELCNHQQRISFRMPQSQPTLPGVSDGNLLSLVQYAETCR